MANAPGASSGAGINPNVGKGLSGSIPDPLTDATSALLALLVEIGGLIVVIMIAGMSDSIGNLMLIIMFGILLLFMVMNYQEVGDITAKLLNLEGAAQ